MKEETYSLSQKTKDFLADEFSKCDYPKQLYPYFEDRFRRYMADEENEEESRNRALSSSKKYVERINHQLQMGHGIDWSIHYASCLDDDHIICTVYEELAVIDKELALQELLLHVKSLGKDELFEKYFVDLVTEEGAYYYDEKLTIDASNYSRICQTELASGKAPCYAQKYAELTVTGDYSEESNRIMSEIYDFANKRGVKELDSFPNGCYFFAYDCAKSYAEGYLFSEIDTLRKRYSADWQQEMLTILYNRYMDEYYDYQDTVEYSKPTKKLLIEDTWDRMFPDGIDDGFTGIINDD